MRLARLKKIEAVAVEEQQDRLYDNQNGMQAMISKKTHSSQQQTISFSDLETECLAHMSQNKIPFSDPLKTDGEFHRFSIDNKKNEPDEWYVAYQGISSKGNPYLNCTYGSWSNSDRKFRFQSWDNQRINDDERKELEAIHKKHEEASKKLIKEEQDNAAKECQRIWKNAETSAPNESYSLYLDLKQVKNYGARFGKNPQGYNSIIIPLCNASGEIRSLQYISVGQKTYKSFHKYGEKSGTFFILGEITNGIEFLVGEGYSTCSSAHEASEKPTVVAFDCNNIPPVIKNLRELYPDSKITIIADNDRDTEDKSGLNPGMLKAEKAASEHNCTVIFPKFPEKFKLPDSVTAEYPNGKRPTDFNDLHVNFGLEEVKRQILFNNASTSSVQDELAKLTHNLLEKEEPCDCFSVSALPKLLADYIESISETTNAHPIMVTCSVLTTISAILKKRVFIKEDRNTGYFQTLYPNLWMLNVTKSGQFKSTALNKGSKLAWEKSSDVLKVLKDFNLKISIEKDKKTAADLTQQKILASLDDPVLPNKMTSEALLEHLGQGHAGAVFTSEFGAWLQNMDSSHNKDFKAIATDLYDVPAAYRYKTKNSGDYILENPFISICGVSTLTWLKSNLKPNDVDSGFLARFLIFAPPHQDEIPPALPRKSINGDKISEHREIENKIKDILKYVADEHSYTLSEEAEIHFEKMHIQLYQIAVPYSDKCREILEPYLKRWSPYLLKLAMIMRLFEDPHAHDISVTSLNSAMAVLLPAIKSTAHLFEGELGESEHQRKCRIVFEWICKRIKNKNSPTWKSIIASKQLEGGSAEYEYVMKTLIESGKLKEIQKGTNKKEWLYVLEKQ